MDKLRRLIKYLLKKAGQKTSWAGIGVIGPVIAPHVKAGIWQVVMYAGPIVTGIVLLWIDDPNAPDKTDSGGGGNSSVSGSV